MESMLKRSVAKSTFGGAATGAGAVPTVFESACSGFITTDAGLGSPETCV